MKVTDIHSHNADQPAQWRIKGRDPGSPASRLFLDQTEARRAEKIFLRPGPPLPYLRVWMTPLPPYLKVWIRHCGVGLVCYTAVFSVVTQCPSPPLKGRLSDWCKIKLW